MGETLFEPRFCSHYTGIALHFNGMLSQSITDILLALLYPCGTNLKCTGVKRDRTIRNIGRIP